MKLTTIIAEPNYSPAAINIYRSLGPALFWFDMDEANREKALKEAEVLVVRLALQVDKKLLDSMSKLKVVATSTTGLNHIDMEYAKEKNIKIISLRGETDFLEKIPSTAEETIGLIISLLRRLPWAFEDVKKGNWNTNNWEGRQLMGKTLGIVGLGRLGKLVAGYANVFKMKVIAADPNLSSEEISKFGARKTELEELLKISDIVSLHVLLTDKTENFIKEKHLRLMKPDSYLVNTARAELIEPDALEKALREKWIAGAAVDVLREEQAGGGHLQKSELVEYAKKNNNLIIVPHIGGTTREAKEITQDYIAELVKKYFKK